VTARGLEELARDFFREALVAVTDRAASDSSHGGHEGERDQEEGKGTRGNADPRPVTGADLGAGAWLAGALPVAATRRAVEQPAAAHVGSIEQRARQQRRERQPDELDLPAFGPQRALTVWREGDRDDRPSNRRSRHQEDRRSERKAREQPADSGKSHQAER